MALADRYVDGGSVRWLSLGQDLVGSAVLAFSAGYTAVALRVGDAIQGLLGGAASFNAELVSTVVGTPGATISAAVNSTVSFVATWGPFAYGVALVLVLVGLWGVAKLLPGGDE